jgi:Tol biopolymer transport system component
MLTGRRAFEGDDVADILAAVMRAEPDWTRLPRSTPAPVRTLLRRCLQKDKALRLRDAGDARIELQETLAMPPQNTDGFGHRLARLSMIRTVVILVAVGVVVALSWRETLRSTTANAPFAQLNMTLPAGSELLELTQLAVSPDGTQLAYVAISAGVQQLHVRSLDSAEGRALRGTEGATSPFFSPDGQWIGFNAGGKLKKIATDQGFAVTLAETTPVNSGGTWAPNDTIAFIGPGREGLLEISASGGSTRTIVPAGETGILQYPEFLPGGGAVLFTFSTEETRTADEKTIEVVTLANGERKTVVEGGSFGRYLASGHLVFLRSGTLMAVPFDLDRLEAVGTPVAVLEGIRETVTGNGIFSCSRTGTCAFAPGGLEGADRTAVLVDRTGDVRSLPLPAQSYGQPRFSPRGDRISFWIERARCDVLVFDVARGASSLLTVAGDSHFPIWTPDGSRITYVARRPGAPGYELFWKPHDASGPEDRLTPAAQGLAPITTIAWTPDGRSLAYIDRGDIWLLPMTVDRKPSVFFESAATETMPAFSPDGRWLAYVSDESGRQEVYVQPFPGPGGKYVVSTAGGTEPVWARDGRELFFRNGNDVMAADIDVESGFSAARPRQLFSAAFTRRTGRWSYDISPDGQHFVMLRDAAGASRSQINILLNWFGQLSRQVPPAS